MRKYHFVAAVTLLLGNLAEAQNASQPSASVITFEEVIVTGEHPGPGLWKVTKGDNVLWILGTYSPLPKRMTWRSRQVETVLKESTEVLGGRQFISNLPSAGREQLMRELTRNPAGVTLKDILPADVYRQFDALNKKYTGGYNRLGDYKPFTAVQELYRIALERSNLSFDNIVETNIARLTRKNKVPYRRLELRDEDPKRTAAEFLAIPLAEEVNCVKAWMNRFDTDLREAKKRANAWATGDIEMLLNSSRDARQPTQIPECSAFFAMSARIRARVAYLENQWYARLDEALTKNRSTLALEGMQALIDRGGLIAMFRAKGYEISSPAAIDYDDMPRLAHTSADALIVKELTPDSNDDLEQSFGYAKIDPELVAQTSSELMGLLDPPSVSIALPQSRSTLEQVTVTGAKSKVVPDDCVAFSLLYTAGGFRRYDWQALDNTNLVLWVLRTGKAYHVTLAAPLRDLTERHHIDFSGDAWLCGSGSSFAGNTAGTISAWDDWNIKRTPKLSVTSPDVNVLSIRLLDSAGMAQLEEQYKVKLVSD